MTSLLFDMGQLQAQTRSAQAEQHTRTQAAPSSSPCPHPVDGTMVGAWCHPIGATSWVPPQYPRAGEWRAARCGGE